MRLDDEETKKELAQNNANRFKKEIEYGQYTANNWIILISIISAIFILPM